MTNYSRNRCDCNSILFLFKPLLLLQETQICQEYDEVKVQQKMLAYLGINHSHMLDLMNILQLVQVFGHTPTLESAMHYCTFLKINKSFLISFGLL